MSFCYSFDEEEGYCGEYDTREAALAAARSFNEKEYGAAGTMHTARVWTAKNGRDALGSEFIPDAAAILIEYATDTSAEAESDGAMPEWLEDVSQEAEDALGQTIKSAFDAWCATRGHVPRLWCVTDIVEHEIGGTQ